MQWVVATSCPLQEKVVAAKIVISGCARFGKLVEPHLGSSVLLDILHDGSRL